MDGHNKFKLFFDLQSHRSMDAVEEDHEKKIRMAASAGRLGMFEWDLTSDKIIWDNLRMREIIGLTEDGNTQDSKKSLQQIVFSDDLPVFEKTLLRTMQSGDYFHVVCRIRRMNDGLLRWVEINGEPEFTSGHVPVKLRGVLQDVTDRIKAERHNQYVRDLSTALAELTTAEEMMQLVGQSLGKYLQVQRCVFFELDTMNHRADVIHEWALSGQKSMLGKHHLNEYVSDEILNKFKTGEQICISDIVNDSGVHAEHEKYAQFEIGAVLVSSFVGEGVSKYAIAIYHDQAHHWQEDEARLLQEVSDRVWARIESAKAEAALRNSEQQLRILTDSLPVLISYADKNHNYRFVNHTYSTWFGVNKEQIVGSHLRGVLGEEAYQAILPKVEKVLMGEKVSYEQMIPYKNAGAKYVVVNYVPDIRPEGNVEGFYVLVQDISERKRRESKTAFLAEIAEDLSGISTAQEIMQTVSKKLGDYLNIPNCLFASVNATASRIKIDHCWQSSGNSLTEEQSNQATALLESIYRHKPDHKRAIVISDIQKSSLPDDTKRSDIRSLVLIPYWREGNWKHLLMLYGDQVRQWLEDEVELMEEKANRLFLRIERAMAEEAIHERERQLAQELEDMNQLQRISTSLIQENNMERLYEQIMDASVALMHADMASLQMFNEKQNILELLAWRGFTDNAAEFWNIVDNESGSTCGEALRSGQRIIVEDVDNCESLIKSADYRFFKESKIKAVQTTPLLSRNGRLVGMISTHWKKKYFPSEREQNLFDVLARQAADLIERTMTEEMLIEADRRKDEFLATLSHELRNPLAPIQGALELMNQHEDEAVNAKAREILKRQVHKMTHLIDDLMDVSRITRNKIHLHKKVFKLEEAVNAAIEATNGLMQKEKHTLHVNPAKHSLFVHADFNRIVQVLTNLLSNAAKYTDPGGKVSLMLEEKEDKVIITVSDNGIGIPPDQLEVVFEMFSQLKNGSSRSHMGLGIGLSLVKNLVEMHQGKITAQSKGEGKGSSFVVELPLASQDLINDVEAKKVVPAKVQPHTKSIKVMVVDDNADITDTLQSGLKREGHQVRACYSGKEALEQVDSFRPDAAVLDIGLRDMQGYELARKFRKKFPNMLLIAHSGWGQAKDKQKALDSGFDHHLVKPVSFDKISGLLRQGKRDE